MPYRNFKTAIYCTVYEIENYDWENFEEHFQFIEKHIHPDKVYLETYRAQSLAGIEKIEAAKKFFQGKNITCSGGITYNAKGKNAWKFKSFCYSSPEYTDEMVRVIEFTAGHFDEIILDDFYFTNCKCDSCITGKGNKSWEEYRTGKLKEISELMVKKAGKVNPSVKIIIKYPNWYDDYIYTGYNLQDQRGIYDFIYTGTETRDPALTQQNLPRYLSYFIMRYLENSAPGRNGGGGWFDPFDCSYNLNSYLEQAYLTLFAKAREATLFCLSALMNDFRQFVPLAGYAFENFSRFSEKLGNPYGIACYKPCNSSGDNYLLPALGMLGLPLEPAPFISEDPETVILSESAAFDPDLIGKMKNLLKRGKTVLITSGLAEKLRDKGLKDIVDAEFKGVFPAKKIAVEMLYCGYKYYKELNHDVLFKKIIARNNDSWPVIQALGGENGSPVLLEGTYSLGKILILNVPERFTDLYQLPVEALDLLRKKLCGGHSVRLSAPAGVGLFLYDNETFIIESFLSHHTSVNIITKKGNTLQNQDTGKILKGSVINEEYVFTIDLAASTFKVFSLCKE